MNSHFKAIIFGGILYLLSNFSFAQARFSLGIHGGVTGVSLANVEDFESQNKVGSMIGGFFRVGNRFYLESGFDYYKNETTYEDPMRQLKTDLKFSSINVPILLGFKLANGDSFNFRIFAGGSIHNIRDLEDNDFFDEDDLQSTYGMLNIGLGADIWRFTLDFKFEQAFDDFFEFQSVNLDGKLIRFTGTIGFLFIK
ncbi:outer membrane beta-barrel protein [Sediminitomix flava]|uniref:Outer membrane protein with beta-barrel domain n=1 Tax=Sediminitomix flava TaxID=379075 RepID=A0A315ZBM1_SEDFL|nr:outer membrane beta-barrel protein [Sediminitomix flava]PWJ42760.1 outer membrane protein with beta-barrel domain [Sediminitomix flava]